MGQLATLHRKTNSQKAAVESRMTEELVRRCWHLLSTYNFDSYVHATVLICLALHYRNRISAGLAEGQAVGPNEVWLIMNDAAMLYQKCGLQQLALENRLTASHF